MSTVDPRLGGDPYAAPLVNRGPAALQHLLVGEPGLVTVELCMLTRDELAALAEAGERLARMARATAREFWPGHTESQESAG